ncbi:MAG: archease [Candidatus Pacearchaeota archaeon]|nr:archease [Candidatus Pacearchaeota archaeon]
MEKFKFLEHTADIKFKVFGKTVEDIFKNSALALREAICDKIKVKLKKEKTIKVGGQDYESLLYKFLEEILYLLDAEDFLIGKVKEIKINGFKLNAVLIGDKASNYKFTNSVKAITYNDMFLKREKGDWIAEFVLDV